MGHLRCLTRQITGLFLLMILAVLPLRAQQPQLLMRLYDELCESKVVSPAFPGHIVLFDCEAFADRWTVYVLEKDQIRVTTILAKGPWTLAGCAWTLVKPEHLDRLESDLIHAVDADRNLQWGTYLDAPVYGLFVNRGSNFSFFMLSAKQERFEAALVKVEVAIENAKKQALRH